MTTAAPLLAVIGVVPTTASASISDVVDAKPIDWDHLPDHVVGPAVPFADEEGPHTIFVNFDGVTLTEGFPDNARENVTSLIGMGGTYVPFGAEPGDPVRAMILDEIREDYAGMWVRVTDERPGGGQYTMIIVSPSGAMPGKNGVASLNCGGSPLGVGFAFFSVGSSSVEEIATTVSHEAGHTFGIEHLDDTDDIMFWSAVNNKAIFVDACVPVDDASPACGMQHEVYCQPGQANSYQELAGLFGEPTDPDGAAPNVTLVAPVEHERFERGEDVVIIAEAEDDISIGQVKLLVDGELAGTKLTPPFEWTKSELDEGLHEISVIARDGGGNETTSETVTIAVGDVALPEAPGDEDDAVLDPDADRLPGADLDDAEAGCGCTTRSPSPLGSNALLLLAVMAGIRRRSGRRIGARR